MKYFSSVGAEIVSSARTGSPERSGELTDIDVQALSDGRFVLSWGFKGSYWVEYTATETRAYRLEWTTDQYLGFQTFSADGQADGQLVHLNRIDPAEFGAPGTADNAPTYQGKPATAALAGGGYALAWEDSSIIPEGSSQKALGIRLEFGGIDPVEAAPTYQGQNPGEADYLVADTGTADLTIAAIGVRQFQPELVELGNGRVVVVWSKSSGSQTAAMGQIFSRTEGADGAEYSAIGEAFQLGTAVAAKDWSFGANAIALSGNRFVATWQPRSGDLQARIFDADGRPLGAAFTPEPYFDNGSDPVLTALAGGGFVATYRGVAIAGQVFDSDGHKIPGGFFQVGEVSSYAHNIRAAALAGGGFVVVWQGQPVSEPNTTGAFEVYIQAFDELGNSTSPPARVAGSSASASGPEITSLANGNLVVSWLEPTGLDDRTEVHSQIVQVNGPVQDLSGADKYVAPTDPSGFGGVVFFGLSGDDNISGSAESDRLSGGDGADQISGKAGRDLVSGGFGRDTIYGGDEADRLSGGGHADAAYGGAGKDRIYGNGGDDRLFGGAGDDEVRGGDGNDLLDGTGGGNARNAYRTDMLDGGTGFDLVTYEAAQSGIRARIEDSLNFASTGEADGDWYLDVEGIIGSQFMDTIGGSRHADDLRGGSGNDTLFGVAGSDRLSGGDGIDILVGGLGKDTLLGGAGNDTFDYNLITESAVGANGRDVILGWSASDKLDLSGIDAHKQQTDNQDFAFIGKGAPNNFVGQGKVKFYHSGGDTYLVLNQAFDNTADFQIVIDGTHALTRESFLGIL